MEANQDKIEQVNICKYLGVLIDKEGKMETKVGGRIPSTSRLLHSLSNKFIRKEEISRQKWFLYQ